MAVGAVLFIMLVNLRGVKESGAAFAIPTYFFIIMMLTNGRHWHCSVTSLVRWARWSIPPGNCILTSRSERLHLSCCCTLLPTERRRLTGVEAISNGITAFKEPRSRNAGITLIWMSLHSGIAVPRHLLSCTAQIGAVFSEQETIISQLARTVFDGRGYLLPCARSGQRR